MQFDHVALQVPDVAGALAWWRENVPGTTVLYEDPTWGLVAAGGAKLAFVVADQHPGHVAFAVSPAELGRLATERGLDVGAHRDGSRSVYLVAPGGHHVEVIAYPDGPPGE